MDIIAMHDRTLEAARTGSPESGLSMYSFGNTNSGEEDHTFPNMFPERNLSWAARLKWSVTPNYEDANHYPVLSGPLNISAKPGEKVKIKAIAADPDGDQLKIKWWYFPVGTYKGVLAVDSPEMAETTFLVPENAKQGETIHFVLQAVDDGSPALTKYLRTVITIL